MAVLAVRLAIAALLLAAFARPALADELRPMSVDFVEIGQGHWTLDWKQPVAGAPGPTEIAVPQVPGNCRLDGEPVVRTAPAALIGHAEIRCEGDVAGGTIALSQLAGRADALVRVAPLSRPVQSFRLTAVSPEATIAERPQRGQVFATYFLIGAEHILMGWDHLLFVIALVLLVAGGWNVVKAATAFTIAHSITLVATTLGYAGLPQRPVEAVIALSIVFLAVELARSWQADGETWTRRWPWIVAFGFGLFHGFGFAGALRDIGLPEGEVAAALLAFNLGVEAGQLLVIALVLALRALAARLAPQAQAPALKAATYAIGIIASYWLVDRVIG